jgi:transcription elongation factor/antiterminator RfaH
LKVEIKDDDLRWYAVYTKNGEEDRAESNLRVWQIETFTPKVQARRVDQVTGKPTSSAKPLFPRYLFARFKVNDTLHKVWFARGVHSVVSIGNQPAPIEDEVIELIQSQKGVDDLVMLGEDFRAGDRVRVSSGPLKDLVGIFERNTKERDRVSILLSVVNYQNRVEVGRGSITKIDA